MRGPVVTFALAVVLAIAGCGEEAAGTTSAATVPAVLGDHCEEVGEAYCLREKDCDPAARDSAGFLSACLEGFMDGCCAAAESCEKLFGEGVSTADYNRCIDDTNNDACGAPALPLSCLF
jgi:hypothetical protein